MYDFLLPSSKKGLREQNVCETKNYEIKICELDFQIWKDCRFKDGEWAEFYYIYIFLWTLIYFDKNSHKI